MLLQPSHLWPTDPIANFRSQLIPSALTLGKVRARTELTDRHLSASNRSSKDTLPLTDEEKWRCKMSPREERCFAAFLVERQALWMSSWSDNRARSVAEGPIKFSEAQIDSKKFKFFRESFFLLTDRDRCILGRSKNSFGHIIR